MAFWCSARWRCALLICSVAALAEEETCAEAGDCDEVGLAQLRRAEARPAVEANSTADGPMYVFGYGSLISKFSRMRSLCNLSDMTETELASMYKFVQLTQETRDCIEGAIDLKNFMPVKVTGVKRGWNDPGKRQFELTGTAKMEGQALDIAPTYLGAVKETHAETYGVIYKVTAEELKKTDEREKAGGYSEEWLCVGDIEVLGDGEEKLPPSAKVRWYEIKDPQTPTSVQPICQSYVDIFVSGALEVEEDKKIQDFAAKVLKTTTDWSEHWVNDRVTPYRPFAKNSGATKITKALENATLVKDSPLKLSHLEAIYFPGAQ